MATRTRTNAQGYIVTGAFGMARRNKQIEDAVAQFSPSQERTQARVPERVQAAQAAAAAKAAEAVTAVAAATASAAASELEDAKACWKKFFDALPADARAVANSDLRDQTLIPDVKALGCEGAIKKWWSLAKVPGTPPAASMSSPLPWKWIGVGVGALVLWRMRK